LLGVIDISVPLIAWYHMARQIPPVVVVGGGHAAAV
jgi:hypothetical protein